VGVAGLTCRPLLDDREVVRVIRLRKHFVADVAIVTRGSPVTPAPNIFNESGSPAGYRLLVSSTDTFTRKTKMTDLQPNERQRKK
jgi:hypothetical protein